MISKGQKLEELICWADFYNNSKNLAQPTLGNKDKAIKVSREINKIKKELMG